MWMASIAAYDPLGQNFTWNERADNVTAALRDLKKLM
jgi:hypothetical protein